MLYKVSYTFYTPLIISEPLHFDALLMAVHPDAKMVYAVNNELKEEELKQLDIPLQKIKHPCGDWVWAASTIDLKNPQPYSGKHTKRKSSIDMFNYVGNVMTNGGLYKDWVIDDRGYIAEEASFIAASGNKALLLYLAGRVRHIGKLRGMGYGEVKDVKMRQYDGSWTDILIKDSRAVRNIPESFLKNEGESSIITHPPYWGMYRREMGAKPGDYISLADGLQLC